jgi:uncharacterized repeat protein (TIGR03803 family)
MRAFQRIICGTVLVGLLTGTSALLPIQANEWNSRASATRTAPLSRSSLGRQLRPDAGFKTLYSFKGQPDGAGPFAALLALNDTTLYGTTYAGGTNGLGSVFSVSTSGNEKLIYNFQDGSSQDGIYPYASLIAVNQQLYGTTSEGGSSSCGCGTVFAVNAKSGIEGPLHRFQGSQGSPVDGGRPLAALLDVNGDFYSTTFFGGTSGAGSVFEVSKSSEGLLYSFSGGVGSSTDGANPAGDLINVNGELYGTTEAGGAGGGEGTVYKINISGKKRGKETVLYSFRGGSDGSEPYAGLVPLNGELYGTTYFGGTAGGGGTVFEVSTSGAERVLYSFAGIGGSNPTIYPSGLVPLNGKLYGETYFGGPSVYYGTVFEVNPASGKVRVLHSFTGSDGAAPFGGLIALNGKLYGTTAYGGMSNYGTVFQISP